MPYSVGNKVRQDGAVYKCNTAIPARGEEWNPNHWTKIDPLQTQIDKLDVLEVGGQNMMLDWLEPYIDDIAGYGNTTVTRNVKMEVGNGYVTQHRWQLSRG